MTRPRLRTGLAVLTVLAVVAVLAVGVPAWYDRWTHWRDSDAHTAVAPALERADGALRAESQLSVRYLLAGEPADRTALATARIRADRAVRALGDGAADAPPAVRAAAAAFVTDWSRWRVARAGVDRRTMTDGRVLERLQTLASDTAAVADSLAALPHVAAADRRAIAQLTRARAALASQQRDLTVALTRATLTREMLASLRAVPGTLAITLDPAREHLTAAGFDFGEFDRAHARTALLARLARDGFVPFWPATDWQARAAAEQTQLDTVVKRALRLTSRVEAASRANAWDALRNCSLLVVAAIALVGTAGIVLNRRVRRPARALTRAVTHAAEGRASAGPLELPGEIVIPQAAQRAAGDTGALAGAIAALDRATLHLTSSAIRAPAPDAELVVKLARRNQPLLSRQLALLDELEAREHDPGRLQSLFQLDQLATRMRRNGESLLVLAGLEPERQAEPAMTLADLVRAAVSEIAHFARIDVVGLPPDVRVSGAASCDLVHALAELLENAATFSRPDTRVFVGARRRADGIELTVADEGIGIPVARLDAYNELLAHPPMPGLDLSRALGLVVVARLCERIGATVRLRSAPDVGTSAVVALPAGVLEAVPATPEVVVAPAGPEPEPAPLRAPVAESERPEAPGLPDESEPSIGPVPAPLAARTPPSEEEGDEVPWPAPGTHDEGVHFTPVPVTRPGDLLPDGVVRPAHRRARNRPSTGTLHRAPVPRRPEATPLGGND